MNEIKYSLIVPIYNAEAYLEECIDSLVKQSSRYNYEIILVNDGSQDDSGNICNRYVKEYDNILLINQTNKGVCNARNNALHLSSGEYICFIDGDDYVNPNMLKILDNYSSSNVDLLSFTYIEFGEDCIEYKKEYNNLQFESGNQMLNYFFSNRMLPYPFVWAYMYKKSVIIENKILFDESMKVCEDFKFNMKFLEFSKYTQCINETLYFYRKNDMSVTASIEYNKLITTLNCKKEYFDIYRSSRLAENIMQDFIRITEIKKCDEINKLKIWYHENLYIIKECKSFRYEIIYIFTKLLGPYAGIKFYRFFSKILHNIF